MTSMRWAVCTLVWLAFAGCSLLDEDGLSWLPDPGAGRRPPPRTKAESCQHAFTYRVAEAHREAWMRLCTEELQAATVDCLGFNMRNCWKDEKPELRDRALRMYRPHSTN